MQINSYTHKRFCIWPCFCSENPPLLYVKTLGYLLSLSSIVHYLKFIWCWGERSITKRQYNLKGYLTTMKKKATTAAELLSDPYGEENNIKKKKRKIYKNIFHFPFMQVRISLLFSLILKVKTFSTHL